DLSSHLGEAGRPALSVSHRADYDARPEQRAILTHAPAFVLYPTVASGSFELTRQRVTDVDIGRIEGGEMPADDFIAAVPLYSLGSCIPAHDMPGGVEGKYCVVLDARHELAIQGFRVCTHRYQSLAGGVTGANPQRRDGLWRVAFMHLLLRVYK